MRACACSLPFFPFAPPLPFAPECRCALLSALECPFAPECPFDGAVLRFLARVSLLLDVLLGMSLTRPSFHYNADARTPTHFAPADTVSKLPTQMADLSQSLEQHIFSGDPARTSMVLAYQNCQFDNRFAAPDFNLRAASPIRCDNAFSNEQDFEPFENR